MTVERREGVFSTDHLIEVSEELNLPAVEVELTPLSQSRDQTRFEGLIGVRHVAEGFDLFANDLVALRDYRDEAQCLGQFFLRIPVRDTRIRAGIGTLQVTEIRTGQALALQSQETIHLEGQFHRGRLYQDVFLTITPDAALEPVVLDTLFGSTDHQGIRVFEFDPALRDKAFNILTARQDDCVLGLLADSVATAILAAYLHGSQAGASGARRAPRNGYERRLAQVHETLLARPHENHRLADLARDAGMSVSSLKTKFREHFGQSVVSYLRMIRLEQARKGLLDEGWSVAQAARSVGYRHTSSFSKAYFKSYGEWPSQVRN